jgi:hypothetical protein
MLTMTKGSVSMRASRAKAAGIVLALVLMLALGGCSSGGGSSQQFPPSVSGNWQFSMAEQLNSDPSQPSFTGGFQGGFLLQTGNTISGQLTFSIMTVPPIGTGASPTQCNGGVAAVSGTLSGQTVNLTATSVGQQTYTLTGTLSFDGSTIAGTYTSTDGAGCGLAATQAWSASSIPIITSTSVQGIFHSAGGPAGLKEQDFLVSGALYQGTNSGAISAPITGSLNFSASGYPCVAAATVSGQISGNNVSLQLMGSGNVAVGQLGQPSSGSVSGLQPLTVVASGNGFILQSLSGIGYAMYASGCGGGTLQAPADSGSVCLAVTSTTACQLPLNISVGYLTFPAQAVGSSKTTQSFTLSNPSSSAIVDGITISVLSSDTQPDFTESDNCGAGGAASQAQPFTLQPSQTCSISVGYAPKESCPTSSSGQCLSATVSIASTAIQTIFNVPVTGAVSGDAAFSDHSDPATRGGVATSSVEQFGSSGIVGTRQLPRATLSNKTFQNSENHADIE